MLLQSAVGAVKIHLGLYTTRTKQKSYQKSKESGDGGEHLKKTGAKLGGVGNGGQLRRGKKGGGASAIQGLGQPHERPERQRLIEGSPLEYKGELELNSN